jgi:8-oxo-dGTP pyrophosphatase MutT (NUDIX family)
MTAMGQWQQKWGVVIYWLIWPALWAYLRFGRRTRVLVVCGQRVLLVKTWLGDGKWSLPGGGLHRHEDPRTGAHRELLEETRLDVALDDFTYMSSLTGTNHGLTFEYDLFVVEVSAILPVQRQPKEIIDVGWFDHRRLTDRQLTPGTRSALRNWFDK